MIYLVLSDAVNNIDLSKRLVTLMSMVDITAEVTPVIVARTSKATTNDIVTIFNGNIAKVECARQMMHVKGSLKIRNAVVAEISNDNTDATYMMRCWTHLGEASSTYAALYAALHVESLSSDDTFIVVNDYDLLSGTAALVKPKNCKVKCVLECRSSESKVTIDASFAYLFDISQLIICGIRHDMHRLGFTEIQAVTAIIDAISSANGPVGLPLLTNQLTSLNYNEHNLQSSLVTEAISKLCNLYDIYCRIQDGDLRVWRERLRIDSGDIWKYNEPMHVIEWICQYYNDSLRILDGFMPLGDKPMVDKAVRKMNDAKQLKPTTNNEERYRLALEHITNSVVVSSESTSSINYAEYKPAVVAFSCHQKNVSPTMNVEYANLAFAQEYMSDADAERLRSNCMEAWFVAYQAAKSQNWSSLTISLQHIVNLSEIAVLQLTHIGRKILEGKWIFLMQDSLGTSSVSSPETGFCDFYGYSADLSVYSRQDSDFRKFLGSYIKFYTNSLSEDFRKYVEMQNKDIAEDIVRNPKEFFSRYRFLSSDIPIEY